MSTQKPEQTPPRSNAPGPLQPRSAASYAELGLTQQQPASTGPRDDAPVKQRSYGWKPVRSPWPGYVGFVAVLIALLMMFSVMTPVVDAAISYAMSHKSVPTNIQDIDAIFDRVAPDASLLLNLAGWIGVIGVVFGAIGALIGRGRGVGIVAVLVGLLSPVLLGFYIGFTAGAAIAK